MKTLIALLARIEVFLDSATEPTTETINPFVGASDVREELIQHGFRTDSQLSHAAKMVTLFSQSGRVEPKSKTAALCHFLMKKIEAARSAKAAAPKTLFQKFAAALDDYSRQRLTKLVAQFRRIPDSTRGVIESDLRGIIQSFRAGPANQIFRAKEKAEITIEEVIDQGLIFVIDLPVAESGNASWPALVALKTAITQRLIGRYKARLAGFPLSRRGVAILQDEAQLLLNDSEAKALSVIREFGVIWVLATQSLSLIASVLNNHADTAAFIAAARVRIFGSTGDEYTATFASRFCGTAQGGSRRLACVWHPTARLEAAVRGGTSAGAPLVDPNDFSNWKRGNSTFERRTTGSTS